jgi:hypothetical protein
MAAITGQGCENRIRVSVMLMRFLLVMHRALRG